MTAKPKSSRSDLKCPFFQKTLDRVCHTCALYVSIQNGDNPAVWDCSFALAPAIQLQVGAAVRQGSDGVQAAVESFRNEVSRQSVAQLTGSPRIVQMMPVPAEERKLLSQD
jgi:hypothetical protein